MLQHLPRRNSSRLAPVLYRRKAVFVYEKYNINKFKASNMLIILRYVLILIVILSVACKDSLITTEEAPAGRRDYVWEVDSIGNNYKNVFHTIWGTDDNNLWLGGGTATLGNYSENVLHFDGKSWNNNHNVRMDPCYEIKGDVDKVFFCAENKVICLENGELTEMPLDLTPIVLSDSIRVAILGMIKLNEEYFASGYAIINENSISAVLWKLNGNKWDALNIFNDNLSDWFYSSVGVIKGKLFFSLFTSKELLFPRIAFYDGKNLHILTEQNSEIKLVETPGDCLFTQGDKILNFNDRDFVQVADLKIGHPPGTRIFGRNKNDLFFFDEGQLYHFNGMDSIVLFDFQQKVIISDCLIIEQSVYFLIYTAGELKHYIIKGKIKN